MAEEDNGIPHGAGRTDDADRQALQRLGLFALGGRRGRDAVAVGDHVEPLENGVLAGRELDRARDVVELEDSETRTNGSAMRRGELRAGERQLSSWTYILDTGVSRSRMAVGNSEMLLSRITLMNEQVTEVSWRSTKSQELGTCARQPRTSPRRLLPRRCRSSRAWSSAKFCTWDGNISATMSGKEGRVRRPRTFGPGRRRRAATSRWKPTG